MCRSPKDYFKRRSSTQPTHALDHAASAEEDSGDDFEHFCLDESVHALPSSASKLFTTLSLSVSGDSFVDVKFQVDSAATCNTLPYHQFKKIGKDSDLQPTSSKLISYSGEAIRPLGKVTLVHQNPQFFMLMDFHVVDLPRKPALLGLPDSSRLSLLHIDSSRVTTRSDQQPAPPPPPVTVSTPAITSTSATPVSSQSALPAPAPQFPSAKSATSQFPLATSASSNPAVQPTVSSRCDPPHEAQTPQSSLQSSVCASGDSSQKSLSQMAPYKTRSGRVVKSPKVFDPSDNV